MRPVLTLQKKILDRAKALADEQAKEGTSGAAGEGQKQALRQDFENLLNIFFAGVDEQGGVHQSGFDAGHATHVVHNTCSRPLRMGVACVPGPCTVARACPACWNVAMLPRRVTAVVAGACACLTRLPFGTLWMMAAMPRVLLLC